MTDPASHRRLAVELLKQDQALSGSQYEEYRMRLEGALSRAEWRERVVGYVVSVACVVFVILLFMGGSRLVGSFDPWSSDATVLSVSLAVLMVIAGTISGVGLASYYSRFRPNVRAVREQVRDATLLDLQRQVHELRDQLTSTRPQDSG